MRVAKARTNQKNSESKSIAAGVNASAKARISAAVHCRSDGKNCVTRCVTALCDAELLGKTLKSGDCVLDLKKYRAFYSGELLDEDAAAALAAAADNLNIVGERALAAARRVFEISEGNVKRIGGVPHAQVYKI
ncbi:MAG: DUF424 family protein [Candidatus Norongarragalinales archaeon]